MTFEERLLELRKPYTKPKPKKPKQFKKYKLQRNDNFVSEFATPDTEDDSYWAAKFR
jgi:hypothetical protein